MAQNNETRRQFSPRILINKPNVFVKQKTTTTTTTILPTTTISTHDLFTGTGPGVRGKGIAPEVELFTKTRVGNGTGGGESEYSLCAPFPPCNPAGCGDPTLAPVDCRDCNKASTGGVIFGMSLLALVIIIANILVIRVILQTPSLRRRHGYIKLSLATSDLLVGLFVIPSAIGNLVTSLYYPIQTADDVHKYGEATLQDKVNHLIQRNSTASIVFGSIVVISVSSSLYNLLLLSVDRFLAIARPLKHRVSGNFSKKSLWLSIGSVWVFGVSLSIAPAFFPDNFNYEMDLTTFFFFQRVAGIKTDNGTTHHFSPYYITIIIGGPYFVTVLLNILTAFFTWKSLQVRNRLSTRRNANKSAIEKKCERNRRMQMLKQAYPEMLDDGSSRSSKLKRFFKRGTPRHEVADRGRYHNGEAGSDEKERHSWLSWWRSDETAAKANTSNSNNVSTDSERSSSQSPRFQRTRDQLHVVRDVLNPINVRTRAKEFKANHKTHVRVFKMIISMVVSFTVCLLPYVIVTLKISDGSLGCLHSAGPFSFAAYMLFLNSGMNFVIYNLWHPEFRRNLLKTFRSDYSKTSGFRRAAGSFFTTSQKGTASSMTYATRSGSTDLDTSGV